MCIKQVPLTKRLFILMFFFLICGALNLYTQILSRYNIFGYGVNEGLLQSTITDMEFDSNNFWWISYPNGIQQFDGKNFLSIPVQPGLPENKGCHFFKCSNGNLLISHLQGISIYNHTSNSFKLVYKHPQAAVTDFIGESDGVVYFYTDNAEITGITAGSFTRYSSFKTGLPDYKKDFTNAPAMSDNIVNGQAAFIVDKRMYTWDLKKGVMRFRSEAFPEISRYLLHQVSEKELLFYTYQPAGTLQVLNTAANTSRIIPVEGHRQTIFGRSVVYQWQDKILLSINDRIYETDKNLEKLRAEIVNFQNGRVARGAIIARLKEDNFKNLYAQTISGGLYKITANNYPLKFFTSGQAEKNYVLSVFPDKKNNRLLAGTANNGLFVFDTLQQLVKHIPMPATDGRFYNPNAILKSKAGDYYIFTVNTKGVWELGGDLKKIRLLPLITRRPPEKSGVGYFCKVLYQDDEKAVVLSETKIYRLNFATKQVYEFSSVNGYIMSGIYCRPYFMVHCNDELIFLDENNFSTVKKIPFKNTGGVRCYLDGGNGKIYAGTNKGIFVTDTSGSVLQQINLENGLPDECIYAMAFDEKSNIWCSTNKGILKLVDGKVATHLKKEDGLQENEFNTNVVAKSDDGEMFFGGVNGVSSFYPAAVAGHNEKLQLLFTRIMANNENAAKDTAAWQLEKIELPYSNNALAFDFVAMGSFNPGLYLYQYRMKGVDIDWVANNGMQTVRYSLPPGNYTLQVYASRAYNEKAVPLKELRIIIHPPFWKTWWFIAMMVVLFALVLGYIINGRNKRVFAKKLQLLENEKQLKEERERISKDLHDSLGAYANAVLYNTELLEREKDEIRKIELLGDLKFASKDIITSLRETVWALKKESYSAEDCFVRIRNFIQPLARYYNHIVFKIEGEAPAGFTLHYVNALNLVRIMQEAVTNSIKHAAPSQITVSSSYLANKWTLKLEDNGTGFNAPVITEERGNGLHNMKSRAATSGFDLQIVSGINKGTQITIIV